MPDRHQPHAAVRPPVLAAQQALAALHKPLDSHEATSLACIAIAGAGMLTPADVVKLLREIAVTFNRGEPSRSLLSVVGLTVSHAADEIAGWVQHGPGDSTLDFPPPPSKR